jgi:hypothetical protein
MPCNEPPAVARFRRVRGYRELRTLIAALAKLDRETKEAAYLTSPGERSLRRELLTERLLSDPSAQSVTGKLTLREVARG